MSARDISDWDIIFIGARTLIGRIDFDNVRPVFQIERQPGPQGMQTIVFPVGWFPVKELDLPKDLIRLPVSSLGPAEQRMLARAVEKADELLQQMLAASSGIALVKEMPK
jgi:hypothetical protein